MKSRHYDISLPKLGDLEPQVLDKFLLELNKLNQGEVLAAGKHIVRKSFRRRDYTYQLSHDVVKIGDIDLSVAPKDHVHGLILQEGLVNRFFPVGTYFLPVNNQYCYVAFSRPLLVRKDVYGHIIADIINEHDCLGSGGSGTVYGYHGSLKYRYNEIKKLEYEPDRKQRAVKIIVDGNGNKDMPRVKKEYDLMQGCSYLGVRPPFFHRSSDHLTTGGLSQKRQKGITLEKLCENDEYSRGCKLTPDDRFRISIALLRQLLIWFHLRNVMHRDIKPTNILVYREGGGWQVKIIDLDLAQYIDQGDNLSCGTPAYCAPEICQGRLVPESDIFSMALVFCYLWREESQIEINNIRSKAVIAMRSADQWKISFDKFQAMDGMSKIVRSEFMALLEKMTTVQAADRLDVAACIKKLEMIYLDYKLSTIPDEQRKAVRDSYLCGCRASMELLQMSLQSMTDNKTIYDMQEHLLASVRLLPEGDASVRDFVGALYVRCLDGCNNKESLEKKMTAIIAGFVAGVREANILGSKLAAIAADLNDRVAGNEADRKELQLQIAEARIFLERIFRLPLDFDVVVEQAMHIERKNKKIRGVVHYFDKVQRDSASRRVAWAAGRSL